MVNFETGTLTLTNSTVSGNTSNFGGGGIWSRNTLTLTNSTVNDNTAGTSGGGIFNYGSLTITNSTVSGNTAATDGGGIANLGVGTLDVTNGTVSGNTAATDSGGIANLGVGTLDVTNSTVSGNTASRGGGIINDSALTITNGTVGSNTADTGGGIFKSGGTVDLANTIISGNNAPTDPDCTGPPTSLSHNLIGNNSSGCGFIPISGDWVNVDPLLGPLQGVGGPTFTRALLRGSPAIAAGNDNAAPPTDQRGVARPQCAASDIGAYEFGPSDDCFPVAFRQIVNTQEDTPVDITLTGSDADTGDTLSFIIASTPSMGTCPKGALPSSRHPTSCLGI